MIHDVIVKAVHLWESMGRPRVTPVGRKVGTGVRHCPSSHPDNGDRAFAWRRGEDPLSFEPPTPESNHGTDIRVRYVGRCVQDRCRYWAGSCQLGAMVTRVTIQTRGSMAADHREVAGANQCPIEQTCRWIQENGPDACLGCSVIDYAMHARSIGVEVHR